MADIIRRVVVQGSSTGLNTVTAELQGVATAQKELGIASTQTAQVMDVASRRQTSVAGSLNALRSSLDAAYRSQQQIARGQEVFNKALQQGLIDTAEHARLLDLLKQKYDGVAASATKAATATRQVSTIAGAAAPRGTITGTGLSGKPAAVDADDIGRMSGQMEKLGQNTRLTSFEMSNLGFQINDIAVMAASGQNPFTLIMQQGMQIAQIMTMSSVATMGLKASMAALGTALVQFIMQPINQVIVGLALAAGALMLFFNSLRSGSVDAETALKTHEDLLEQIKDRYGEAAVAAIQFQAAASGQGLAFKAQTNVLSAEAGARTALGTAADALAEIQERFQLGLFETTVEAPFVGLNALIEEFKADAADGIIVTQDWIDRFVALGDTAPDEVRATTVEVLALIEATEKANRIFEEARRARAVAAHDVERMARSDATIFAGQAPGVAAGINTKAVFDASEELVRLAGSLETAERAARASATGFEASFETVKQAVIDAAVAMAGSLETAEQAARASARGFEASFERVKTAAIDAAVAIAGSLETAERAGRASARGFETGLEDLRKANERAAEEEARRRAREAESVQKEAERKAEFIEELRFEHEIMDLLKVDQEVAIALRNLGADATTAQKEAVEALTRSMFEYEEAVKAAEEADKKALKTWEDATEAAISKMDEFRSSAKGILSGFIEGGPQGAIQALQSRLTQLGEDMLIEGLFGKTGAAGGGLFGGLVQDLLGGMPEKPVATMNVVAGVVNVGGVGAGAAAGSFRAAQEAGMGVISAGSGGTNAFLDLISKVEGTSVTGYNTTLAHGIYAPGGVEPNLTGGTIDQAIAIGRHILNNPANPYGAGPVGRYQITPTTLARVAPQMGLTGSELFDPAMQDRIAMELARQRMAGQGVGGLYSEWAGLGAQGIPRSQVQSAWDDSLTTASTTAAPAVDELAKSIDTLKAPIDAAVPALGQLASTILNFSPGGTAISAQAASAITSGFGGLFQHGGILGAGKWGIAGEHGPEMIHGPASVTPMQGGAGSPRFNVNIKTQEGVTARVTRAEQNDQGDFDLEVFATAIEHNIRDKYGLRTSPSRWGRAA